MPSCMPRSANALAKASIAALIEPTAAVAGSAEQIDGTVIPLRCRLSMQRETSMRTARVLSSMALTVVAASAVAATSWAGPAINPFQTLPSPYPTEFQDYSQLFARILADRDLGRWLDESLLQRIQADSRIGGRRTGRPFGAGPEVAALGYQWHRAARLDNCQTLSGKSSLSQFFLVARRDRGRHDGGVQPDVDV